jgi:hypothetical protein
MGYKIARASPFLRVPMPQGRASFRTRFVSRRSSRVDAIQVAQHIPNYCLAGQGVSTPSFLARFSSSESL